MADAQRTIDLVFNGVDKTGAATQAALKNTEKFAGGVQSATQPIADFTTSALKLEAGLLAAGAAFTAFAINEASGFESSLAELNKVLGEGESLDAFATQARNLGKEYGVAIEEVVGSIADFKQAGFTAEEAATLTKSGLDLVIAGGIEAARASDLVVASLKGFGAEAQEVVPFVDLLNQVSNEYAVSVDQLLEGFATFSPIAKSAGLSLQETVGILTPGIEVFRSGSEVANALRTAFLKLQDDAGPVTEALKTLGVTQKDSNGQLRSGRDIFFDVANALGDVDENQRAFIASQLVGIQRSSQFLATIDGLDKSLRIAGDGFDFLGSAAKEVEIQLATANKAADRTKVAFNDLQISIGQPFLDEFAGVADAISAIFSSIGGSLDNAQISELVGFIEGEFEGLQATLEAVARNLPQALDQADLSGFLDGLQAVSDAFGELFGGVDLTTVDGLAAAITNVADAFEVLSEFSAGAIESFGPLLNQLAEIGGTLLEISPELANSAGAFGGFATQANLLSGTLVSLLPSIEALVGIIALNQGASLAGALGSATRSLTGAGGLISLLGKAGLTGAAGGAGFAVGTLANNLTEFATGTSASTFLADFAISLGLIDDEATKLANSLNERTSPSADAVARSISEADAEMAKLAKTAGESEKGVFNFSTGLSELGDEAERLPQSNLNQFFEEGVGELLPYTTALDQAGEATEKLGDKTRKSAGSFSVVSTEAEKATSAIETLANAGAEIKLELALAGLEAQTEITTARIEADAKKTVAAFESISTSVESTGDSLNELFGLLGDDTVSKFDKLGIKEQIEIENERREESLRLQKRLTEEQIREARARRQSLENGQGLITVNGDGLAPHLEAFMFEILEAIQVRANADGFELLLGAGS